MTVDKWLLEKFGEVYRYNYRVMKLNFIMMLMLECCLQGSTLVLPTDLDIFKRKGGVL